MRPPPKVIVSGDVITIIDGNTTISVDNTFGSKMISVYDDNNQLISYKEEWWNVKTRKLTRIYEHYNTYAKGELISFYTMTKEFWHKPK